MGCFQSSPHQARYSVPGNQFLGTADVMFGKYADACTCSVRIPDNIDALSSTQVEDNFSQAELLYSAEIDHGSAYKACRIFLLVALPCVWPMLLKKCMDAPQLMFNSCDCSPMCCWVQKEFSTRTRWGDPLTCSAFTALNLPYHTTSYRIWSNRISITSPTTRIPWACCGCGSWNIDNSEDFMFDRGTFGFRRILWGTHLHSCCCWEIFGGVVARQRCPCNGTPCLSPVSECPGLWCDEWLCNYCGCTYYYGGLANPDEVVFASNLALQAYFEGRHINKADFDKCITIFRESQVASRTCDERSQYDCAIPACVQVYNYAHHRRQPPSSPSNESLWVFKKYHGECEAQRLRYREETMSSGPKSSLCRILGCKSFLGRGGVCFCIPGRPKSRSDVLPNVSVVLQQIIGSRDSSSD
jgi:hypothetical protein